jgi:hypothetical protein
MVLLDFAPEEDDKVISEEIFIKLFPLFICNTFGTVSILITMIKSHHESHTFVIVDTKSISILKAKASDFIGRVITPFVVADFTNVVFVLNIVTSSVHVTQVETIHEADPINIGCIKAVVEHLASEFSVIASVAPKFTEVVVFISVIPIIIITAIIVATAFIPLELVFTKVPRANNSVCIFYGTLWI